MDISLVIQESASPIFTVLSQWMRNSSAVRLKNRYQWMLWNHTKPDHRGTPDHFFPEFLLRGGVSGRASGGAIG